MNLACQIYTKFDSNYILKKICVKTELLCLLTGAYASSTSIILSSSNNMLCLCISSTVRLVLNTTSLF